MLMKGYNLFMKWAILKSPYLSNTLWPQDKNLIFGFSIFQSSCLLIFKVVSELFVEIIKCELIFPWLLWVSRCNEHIPDGVSLNGERLIVVRIVIVDYRHSLVGGSLIAIRAEGTKSNR